MRRSAQDWRITASEGTVPVSGEPVTIVMIEDDAGHALPIERSIRRAGVSNELVPFASGAEALNYLLGPESSREASAKKHLLVLLDLNLRDMNGMAVLEKLKANPHTMRSPVVVLTTTEDPQEMQRCYDLGANVYVTPWSTNALRTRSDSLGYSLR